MEQSPSSTPLAVEPEVASAPLAPPRRRMPAYGEQAPEFTVASNINPRFKFYSLGGQWMVLLFFGGLGDEVGRAAHDRVLARRGIFDDRGAQLFGISNDPADRAQRGLTNSMPGLRYFWDFDRKVADLYGVAHGDLIEPTGFLLDPMMRVAAREPASRIDLLLDRLEGVRAREPGFPADGFAPILTVPRILEPQFCRVLVEYHQRTGGQPSGFMREIDGVTFPMLDDKTKRRRDVIIEDEALCGGLRSRLGGRLLPAIARAFWWNATRIERYIVSCYSAEEAGFFSPHRDNTTGGTAHRRFAVSINLNDDFDGGELRFPEFGMRTYRPPLGGATVFSCNLLHEATPVTRGERYATLPFLYDESGAELRAANKHMLAPAAPSGA